MKKCIITTLLLIVSMVTYAQEVNELVATRATSLQRQYLRPSMSMIFITDGTATARTAAEKLDSLPNLKFDNNPLQSNFFVMSNIPSDKKERETAVKSEIENIIKDKKIGNQIMKNWFPNFTKENGYGIDVLMQRGEFAATDNDVLSSNASARTSALNSLGERLIDRSYLVAVVIKDATTVSKDGKRYESVKIIPYTYKLNFNEEIQKNFYDNYYMSPTGIDDCEFPLIYVTNAKSGVLSDPNSIDDKDLEHVLTLIGKKVADFQVKTAIVSTNPVKAKIGKKEGVRIDKRYAVMEYRQDENGNEYAKRIASLRAKKVADNYKISTGNTEDLSTFYYIKGRPAREGMTIVENPDFGAYVDAQYNIAGPGINFGYRMGLPGFMFYLNVGLANNEKGGLMKVMAVTDKEKPTEMKETPVLKMGIGFAKELYFMRNFVLTPSISGGILLPVGAKEIVFDGNNAYANTDKMSMDSYYIEGAVKFGYMITRELQIFAEAGYNVNILGDQFKFMRDSYANDKIEDPKDPMKLRFGAGLKYYF